MSQGLRSQLRTGSQLSTRQWLRALGGGAAVGVALAASLFVYREVPPSPTARPAPPVRPAPAISHHIQWLDLEVRQTDQSALLRWATGFEQNCQYFQVERAVTRDSFVVVGQVPAHGSSSMLHTYRFEDQQAIQLSADTLRYRLRQVGTQPDEAARYSRVLALAWQPPATGLVVKAHPNPAYDHFELRMQGQGDYQMEVLTPSGETVRTQALSLAGSHTLAFEADDWGKGLYLIRLSGPQGRKTTGVWIR